MQNPSKSTLSRYKAILGNGGGPGVRDETATFQLVVTLRGGERQDGNDGWMRDGLDFRWSEEAGSRTGIRASVARGFRSRWTSPLQQYPADYNSPSASSSIPEATISCTLATVVNSRRTHR